MIEYDHLLSGWGLKLSKRQSPLADTEYDHLLSGWGLKLAGDADIVPVDLAAVRLQAVAIATRSLAIQLGRAPNGYREFLSRRLAELLR